MADPATGADRRQHERIATRVEVRFGRTEDAARALRAYSLNFSAGGICLRTSKTYAVGDGMRVAMKIEGEEFDLHAAVAWCRAGTIGVRFDELSNDDRARLERVAQALRRG